MEKWSSFFLANIYLIKILIGIAILFTLHFVFKFIVKHYQKRSYKENWIRYLDDILISPLKCLLIFIGAFIILSIVTHHLNLSKVDAYLSPFRNSGIVVIFTWLLLRWKNVIFRIILERENGKNSLDRTTLEFLNKLVSVVIFFLSLLIILSVFGLNILPLLAFGGIGAAAIGFAAKDLVANFISGLMMQITRPFKKGDYISLEGKSIEGYVDSIGWYFTLIRDFESCEILIPNSLFSTILFQNQCKRSSRKIEERFLVRKEDVLKIQNLVKEVNFFLEKEEPVDKTFPFLIYLDTFTQDGLSLKMKFYLKTIQEKEYLLIKQNLLLKIYTIFKSHDVDFSLPRSKIEIVQG